MQLIECVESHRREILLLSLDRIVEQLCRQIITMRDIRKGRPKRMRIEQFRRRIGRQNEVRLLSPLIQIVNALLDGSTVLIIRDVVDEPHVGVECKHRRSFGLGKQLQAVVKILGGLARKTAQ